MNLVGEYFGDADMQYDRAIEPLGGASNLLWYLDSGREAEQARRASREWASYAQRWLHDTVRCLDGEQGHCLGHAARGQGGNEGRYGDRPAHRLSRRE
jgi:hypothetical protein